MIKESHYYCESADTAEAAAVAPTTFRRQLKTFQFRSAYGHRDAG